MLSRGQIPRVHDTRDDLTAACYIINASNISQERGGGGNMRAWCAVDLFSFSFSFFKERIDQSVPPSAIRELVIDSRATSIANELHRSSM